MVGTRTKLLTYWIAFVVGLVVFSLACGIGGNGNAGGDENLVEVASTEVVTQTVQIRTRTPRPVATFAVPTPTVAPTATPFPGTDGTSWLIATYTGDGDDYVDLAFSPDGARLALASRDNFVRLMNPESGEILRTLVGHTSSANQVVFSPDGNHLFSSANDGTILQWNIDGGARLKVIGDSTYGKVNQLDISSNGALLVSSSGVGSVNIWDAGSGEFLSKYIGGYSQISGLSFSPNNTEFASSSLDGFVFIFPTTGVDSREITKDPDPVKDVVYSDRNHIASAHKTGVWLWDLTSGQVMVLEPVPSVGEVNKLAVSSDGALLAALSKSGSIWVWELKTVELLAAIAPIGQEIFAIGFSPVCQACPANPGWMLAGSGRDGQVWLWGIQKQPTE